MSERSVNSPDIFPTRENCNREIPGERFLWMFVGLPQVTGGAMPFPVPYLRKLSEHFVDLGMMDECPRCGHHETPKKWLDLPDDAHALLNPGVWREGAPPEQPRTTRSQIAGRMTRVERQAWLAELQAAEERAEAEGGMQ
ncbi:DUF2744 domain-containing protein [Tsukamurella sp. NPDC003166]|uniref:phage gene 29 protein family protein n=1 Tax=Tsukamurella sp. NPDC003166 TaxID=3154444 RepID=UPI0033A74DEF